MTNPSIGYYWGENFAQKGWQCPICNRVYAPATPMCFYCGNQEIKTSSTTTLAVDPEDIKRAEELLKTLTNNGVCEKASEEDELQHKLEQIRNIRKSLE